MFKLRLPAYALAAMLVGTIPIVAAAATVVVTPATPGWSVVQETATGSGAFVAGPATPPSGTGSLQLTVGPGQGGVLASTLQEAGRRFDSLSALGYTAYVVSAPNPGITAGLQIDIDYDANDGTTAWQGRLVFDPGSNPGNPVPTGAWQNYDVKNAPAGWFSTGTPIVGNATQAQICTQATPCTWTQVKTAYPNAGVRALVGAFGVKLGNFGGAGTVAVDSVVIGETIYNFEPAGTGPVANCSNFTDLNAGDIYCSAVEWMSSSGVTTGYPDNTFRPGDVVSRASMALFIDRLRKVVTPEPTLTEQQTLALDPAKPYQVLCQTKDLVAKPYSRTAINQYMMNVKVTGTPAIYPVLSVDQGATWFVYANGAVVTGNNSWTAVSSSVNRNIEADESVRFGVAVVGSGAATVSNTNCQLNSILVSRNPTSSSYDEASLKPLANFAVKH